MKQLLLTLLLVLGSARLCAQTYEISFVAQGDATSVDEVVATNLTTSESVVIPGGEVLTLQLVSTDINNVKAHGSATITSNVGNNYSEMHFTTNTDQEILIQLIALDGRVLANYKQNVQPGNHTFRLAGDSQGIYIVNIATGSDYIGLKFYQSRSSVSAINHITSHIQSQELKSTNAEHVLSLSPDDHISYAIRSGDYTTMIVECPSGDKTLTADMVECVDGDGNYYPVVKIGSQTWMAKNINTSKYTDGTEIPYKATKEEWGAIPDHNSGRGYSYIREEYADLYGALYTYGSAVNGTPLSGAHIQGVCPNGWHIPSDAEWKTLADYLGGTYYAGNKLKACGFELWKESPNGKGDNSSGFNALPSGYRRAYDGASTSIGYYANWWSSNQYNSTYAYYCRLSYSNSNIELSYYEKTYGFCVRCIKD